MTDRSSLVRAPAGLVAVERVPLLWSHVGNCLVRQAERIQERTTNIVVPSAVLTEIEQIIDTVKSGLIRVEGPAGSGVTTLLCHLAATRPSAFWLAEDDAGQGMSALCAQLIAFGQLLVPLVPPAAPTDARVLEDLLHEAASRWSGAGPLLILVDSVSDTAQPLLPTAAPFPARLPPNVVVVYGCTPSATAPLPPVAQIALQSLAVSNADLVTSIDPTVPEPLRHELGACSEGNFLYLRLAPGLLRTGFIAPDQLPVGLEALHRTWWNQLDACGRRLALLLAAAGEPLPNDLATELLGTDPIPITDQWGALVEHVRSERAHMEADEATVDGMRLYHQATRAFLTYQARKELLHLHRELVTLTQRELLADRAHDGSEPSAAFSWEARGYLLRQFARHAFLGPAPERAAMLISAASRTWVRLQQRQGSRAVAAHDAAWELWGATIDGPLSRVARSTFLAGSLATLARWLPTDAPADALILLLDTTERDLALKQILGICDQLPDSREKAASLRRLGEVCYGERRMRTTAMRLLSQAIDLEAQIPSKAWRDEREQLLTIFARTALQSGYWKEALEIGTYISHHERRGMVETEVVRALIGSHDLERAELVAHGIGHESLRPWAQAEVVVARAQAGDVCDAETMLEPIVLETANAWAQIEIACEEARNDEEAAKGRIERIVAENQRNRGRARLAHALAVADKDGDALAMAERISTVAERVTALLDLRLTLEGLVGMLALEQATAVISSLEGDDRVPLIAALAAAHAALGRSERALGIVEQLEADEERDRARARVAVALAGNGEFDRAHAIVARLGDADERDWALDELARMLGRAGRWQEAYQQGHGIADDDQRAKTLAELAIDQARQGEPVVALKLALSIDHDAERNRALTALVPLLIAAGHSDIAVATQDHFELPDPRSRYQTALVIALLESMMEMASQQAASRWAEARKLALTIRRPGERVHALIALAHSVVDRNPTLAQATLGLALRTGASSRREALRCLEWAAPTLVRLGGARLLVEIATAIDDIDSWLHD